MLIHIHTYMYIYCIFFLKTESILPHAEVMTNHQVGEERVCCLYGMIERNKIYNQVLNVIFIQLLYSILILKNRGNVIFVFLDFAYSSVCINIIVASCGFVEANERSLIECVLLIFCLFLYQFSCQQCQSFANITMFCMLASDKQNAFT